MRIQLYDKTNLMLNQVNIDYQLSSEPVFTGGAGVGITGTLEYCDNNECSQDGAQHCRYKLNELLFLSLGHQLDKKKIGKIGQEIF